jgi:hypothetical protein
MSDEDKSTIFLTENQIESIETGNFSNSNDLSTLLLSGNKLKILLSGAFDGFECLTHLSL